MEVDKTSIVLRVRRTIVQDAHISVPLSDFLLRAEPEPDGSRRLDFDAFVAEGLRLSNDPGVEWQEEHSETIAHPMQGPVPANRTTYRPERRR